MTARHWITAGNNEIICELCPRYCHLKPNQRGFCYVRQNQEGQLILTTYGRSSGFCIDPIEKKPLNHFYPGTPILSFGTAGCNLGCKFCQNWNMSKALQLDQMQDIASPEQIAQAAKTNHCHSVAFTYNEPIIFEEYAYDIAIKCHELGIHTVAVSAGYINPIPRKAFFSVMDAANIDLKAFSESFYRQYCNARLQPVLDTLEYLCQETTVWVEITTLLIPTLNDSEDELQALSQWIYTHCGPSVPLHFTAFHPDYKLSDLPRTPLKTLHKAREIAIQNGLQYVYCGNTLDPHTQSTFCPNCNAVLVERNGYQLGQYAIQNQKCQQCQTLIPGRWQDQLGHWDGLRARILVV